jgi:ribosome-associated protein
MTTIQFHPDFYREFQFIASRSSGAGGQNVNKVSSKISLRFDVFNSTVLDEDQKQILKEKLGTQISLDGILQIVSQEDRSQLVNKEICVKKFFALLTKCFTRQKKRRPTKPTKSSVRVRLEGKKKESQKKASRGKGHFEE